jgi:hypothetical protein
MTNMPSLERPTSLYISDFNMISSDFCSKTAEAIEMGECSSWNYIWLIPTNLICCAGGLLYIPVSFVVNLLAAVVFKLLECCARSPEEVIRLKMKVNLHLAGAVGAIADDPATLFIRMGNMKMQKINHISSSILTQLTVCLIQAEIENQAGQTSTLLQLLNNPNIQSALTSLQMAQLREAVFA